MPETTGPSKRSLSEETPEPPSKRIKNDLNVVTVETKHLGSTSFSTLETGQKPTDPKSSDPAGLSYCIIGPHWNGLDEIQNFVVFGDSTTRFGNCTTWLGHLLQSLVSRRKPGGKLTQAYNYATAGDTVEDDLSDQLNSFFEQFPTKEDDSHSRCLLKPSETLYVLWLGINDCGRTEAEDLEEIIEKLFDDGLDDLYTKAGARNFLLIDVPPKDRCPDALKLPHVLTERYEVWNEHLRAHAQTFASDSGHVSVLIFSAYQAVSAILDDPERFGFDENDVSEEGGAIWVDGLHMTTEVHAIVAEQIDQALCAVHVKPSH